MVQASVTPHRAPVPTVLLGILLYPTLDFIFSYVVLRWWACTEGGSRLGHEDSGLTPKLAVLSSFLEPSLRRLLGNKISLEEVCMQSNVQTLVTVSQLWPQLKLANLKSSFMPLSVETLDIHLCISLLPAAYGAALALYTLAMRHKRRGATHPGSTPWEDTLCSQPLHLGYMLALQAAHLPWALVARCIWDYKSLPSGNPTALFIMMNADFSGLLHAIHILFIKIALSNLVSKAAQRSVLFPLEVALHLLQALALLAEAYCLGSTTLPARTSFIQFTVKVMFSTAMTLLACFYVDTAHVAQRQHAPRLLPADQLQCPPRKQAMQEEGQDADAVPGPTAGADSAVFARTNIVATPKQTVSIQEFARKCSDIARQRPVYRSRASSAVTYTLKIQSAHVENLPSNMLDAIDASLLSQHKCFVAGVSIRSGCIELMLDVVDVLQHQPAADATGQSTAQVAATILNELSRHGVLKADIEPQVHVHASSALHSASHAAWWSSAACAWTTNGSASGRSLRQHDAHGALSVSVVEGLPVALSVLPPAGTKQEGRYTQLRLRCTGVATVQQLGAMLSIRCNGTSLAFAITACDAVTGQAEAAASARGAGGLDEQLTEDERPCSPALDACIDVFGVPACGKLSVQLWGSTDADSGCDVKVPCASHLEATTTSQRAAALPPRFAASRLVSVLVVDDPDAAADAERLLAGFQTAEEKLQLLEDLGLCLQHVHGLAEGTEAGAGAGAHHHTRADQPLPTGSFLKFELIRAAAPSEDCVASVLVMCLWQGCPALARLLLPEVSDAPGAHCLHVRQASTATAMQAGLDSPARLAWSRRYSSLREAVWYVTESDYGMGCLTPLHVAVLSNDHSTVRLVLGWEHAWRRSAGEISSQLSEVDDASQELARTDDFAAFELQQQQQQAVAATSQRAQAGEAERRDTQQVQPVWQVVSGQGFTALELAAYQQGLACVPATACLISQLAATRQLPLLAGLMAVRRALASADRHAALLLPLIACMAVCDQYLRPLLAAIGRAVIPSDAAILADEEYAVLLFSKGRGLFLPALLMRGLLGLAHTAKRVKYVSPAAAWLPILFNFPHTAATAVLLYRMAQHTKRGNSATTESSYASSSQSGSSSSSSSKTCCATSMMCSGSGSMWRIRRRGVWDGMLAPRAAAPACARQLFVLLTVPLVGRMLAQSTLASGFTGAALRLTVHDAHAVVSRYVDIVGGLMFAISEPLPLRWRLPLMVVAAVPRYCMYLACCRQFDIAMSPLLRSAANLLAYVSAAETFRIIFMRGVHRQRMMSLPSSPSPSRSSPLRMADTVWGRAEGKARFLKQD